MYRLALHRAAFRGITHARAVAAISAAAHRGDTQVLLPYADPGESDPLCMRGSIVLDALKQVGFELYPQGSRGMLVTWHTGITKAAQDRAWRKVWSTRVPAVALE